MITSKASIANAAAIAKPRSASDNDAKRKIPRKNGRYRIAAKSAIAPAITQQYAVLLERSICQRFRDQERLTVIKPNRPTTKFVKVNALAVASLSRPWARNAGVRKLELHVFPWNKPAIALYEQFGFVHEGTRRKNAFRNGGYADSHVMARVKLQ